MSHVPLRDLREAIRRRLSTDHLVSAELVVELPDGTELCRAGGVWDDTAQAYVEAPEGFDHQPERLRLQKSQVGAATGLARWLERARQGEEGLPVVYVLGGGPGSGKTFLMMLWHTLVALEWPGDPQFISLLNLGNRAECLEALAAFTRPEWFTEVEDPKDPLLQFVNGSTLRWVSAHNARKLRQRGLPIRSVGINEAQDQGEELYAVAQTAPRRHGGCVVLTCNPPTSEGGNWVARLWYGIEAGEVHGEIYQMDPALNAAVNQRFLSDSGQAVRVATPRLAGAHVDGVIRTAGPTAYPSFDGRPASHARPTEGGCVGSPPDIGWTNVTAEIAASIPGGIPADVLIGCDFQKHPGCVGVAAQLYRTADRRLVLYLDRVIGVPGQEDAFSQALVDAGYTGNGYRADGSRGPRALLIGDATGSRQNAEHKRWLPPSYHALQAMGWVVAPPDRHHKTRAPWNPGVLESLDQMFVLLERRDVLLGPRCREPVPEFGPSLVDSFRNAQKWEHSGRLRREVFQHAPDCVRYLAWAFLPRHKAEAKPMDVDSYQALRGL